MKIWRSHGLSSVLCRAVTWLLTVGISIGSALAQPAIPGPDRAKALRQWADASGLTADWDFPLQLRQTTHPSGGGQAWTLDLRFLHRPTDHDDDQENQRLAQFLARYQADNGLSFPDKVFYKFLQICGLRRTDAAVDLNVGADAIAVFVDRSSGELVSKLRGQRLVRESAVIKVPPLLSQARSLAAALPDRSADQDLPQKIREFLESYFQEANRSARLAPPMFVPDCEGNHVGLTVSGLRNQVFTNGMYWEKIQVEVDVSTVSGGVQLTTIMDSSYASGIKGSGLPGDYPGYSDHDYPKELKDFSKILFDKLKMALTKGAA